MAPFLTLLALKIRIAPETLHEIYKRIMMYFIFYPPKNTKKHEAVALM